MVCLLVGWRAAFSQCEWPCALSGGLCSRRTCSSACMDGLCGPSPMAKCECAGKCARAQWLACVTGVAHVGKLKRNGSRASVQAHTRNVSMGWTCAQYVALHANGLASCPTSLANDIPETKTAMTLLVGTGSDNVSHACKQA